MQFAKVVIVVAIGRSSLSNSMARVDFKVLNGYSNCTISLGLSINVAIFADDGFNISVTDFN